MDEFLFPGSIWFIAPSPPYHSLRELSLVVLNGFFEDSASGRMIPGVYAFSDKDLAERFLANAGPQAEPYGPLALADDGQLVVFLEELRSNGHQFLNTDVERSSACLLPIAG